MITSVTIFKIVLLMNLLSGFLIKRRGLSCGLTGYCGGSLPDLSAIKLIAKFNEERGKDSCGIFYAGKVKKGWTGNKPVISDLMNIEPILPTKAWRNVVIHTRKSSSGFKTEKEVHPYEYEDETGYKMWFVHNGTITNWRELCKSYDLNPADYVTDSHAIGAIIFKERNAKVFSKYDGVGAFLFWDNREKNTLWAYRGEGGGEHERPLYFWQNSREDMYISSLIEPLNLVSNGVNDIFEFKGNILYKITNGKIMERHSISRKEELNSSIYRYASYSNNNSSTYEKRFPHLIDREVKFLTSNYSPGRAYWRKGRFWRDGKTLHGKILLSEKTGHFKRYKNELMVNRYFWHGLLLLDAKAFDDVERLTKESTTYMRDLGPYLSFPACSALSKTFTGTSYVMVNKNVEVQNMFYGTWSNRDYYQIPFTWDAPVTLEFEASRNAHLNNLVSFSRELIGIHENTSEEEAENPISGRDDWRDPDTPVDLGLFPSVDDWERFYGTYEDIEAEETYPHDRRANTTPRAATNSKIGTVHVPSNSFSPLLSRINTMVTDGFVTEDERLQVNNLVNLSILDIRESCVLFNYIKLIAKT